MQLKFKQLDPSAELPRYATDGAACFDIKALCPSGNKAEGWQKASFSHSMTFRTGLAVEVPQGHVLMLYSRSGHGFKSDVRLANCVGVIDSDYRGELMVKLTRDVNEGTFDVNAGDRIVQGMLVPAPQHELVWADELSDTVRGAGGFGHTGA